MFSNWHFNDTITKTFNGTEDDQFYWRTPGVCDAGYSFYGRYTPDGRYYVFYTKISFCGGSCLHKASFIPENGVSYKFLVKNEEIIITADAPIKDLKYGK